MVHLPAVNTPQFDWSRARAGNGLRPMGASVNEYCGRLPLYLVLSIPELDLNRWDLPPSVHYVGSCPWHPPQEVV